MKRLLKHLAVILGVVTVSLMATYLGLAVYYHNAFTYGTWINGIYCTGRSIQEVNDELVKISHTKASPWRIKTAALM